MLARKQQLLLLPLLAALLLCMAYDVQGFTVLPMRSTVQKAATTAVQVGKEGSGGVISLKSSRGDDNDDNARTQPNVRVNLLPEVDAVTITAIGFGLIAFNFFVLGNSGDGGIAGIIATISNLLRE